MAIGASQGNVIASAFVRIQPETSGFGPALRQTLATNLLQLEKQNEGFLNKVKGSIGTTAKLFATAGATSLSLFGASAISSAKDLEKTSNAFKGLFGSVSEGKKQFDAVFKLAEVTPFEGSGLAKDFQKFTASFASQGVPLKTASDKTMKILQSLADGGSALGASSENIDGFALALTQTVGKGKLTGEEIRQMTNNLSGFNVVAAVANHTGMSTAKVYEEMRKGAISSDVAIESIMEGLNKIPGAAGASARQLRTVSGAMSTVKDIFQRSTFDGLAEPLKVVANTLVDNAEVFRAVFKTMAEELGGLVITSSGIFSEVISDFDATFGKLAIGGLQAAGASLYGFKDGLKESLQQLGILGDLLQKNQGYFVLLGRGLGNISVGFSEFFTHVIKGFEPTFKVFSVFFDMFGRGFKDVMRVFGPQLERGLTDSGMAIMGVFNNLRESFTNVFDSKVAASFLKTLAAVGRGLFDLVIKPLDALSMKTDGIANGFEKMLKTWTPPLKEFQAAITGLSSQIADIFTGIDTNALSDFAAGTGKHVIEAFTALAQYGGIFVNIMETLLQVLTPINEIFGNLAEQAGAAFIVFKLTGSPLLTLISLFKDLDTGMVVFFLTLSKVVPLIKQTQAALASLKTSQFLGGLTQITNGVKLLGKTTAGTSVSLSQFVGQLSGAGQIGDKKAATLQKMLRNNNVADLNIGFKENQKILLDLAGGAKRTAPTVALLSKEMNSLTMASGRFTTTNRGITGILAGFSNGLTKASTAAQAFNSNGSKISTTASGLAVVSKNAQDASVGMQSTLKPASALGGALGSIGGLATSLGLGIGVSLLTSHLASAAEQASKTKQQIKEMADLSFSYLKAGTGQEKDQALAEAATGIQDRFGENKKALGTFNSLLARNNLSTEQFWRDMNANSKTRTKTVGLLVKDLLKETARSNGGGDIFESTKKGFRDISSKKNEQALDFYTKLATVDGAELKRSIGVRNKGTLETILKSAGVTEREWAKASKVQRDKIIKDSGFDKLFQTSVGDDGKLQVKGQVQLTEKNKEVAVVLGQISKGAIDGKYALDQYNKSLLDSETLAKDAAESYKLFGESQKIALSSSSAFFDKVFEARNPENKAKMTSLAKAAKQIGLDGSKLIQKQEGRDFLTPFSGFKEAEDAIKTNVNAPVAQTIGLLKQSNEEVVKFGKKNIGLSADEIKKVQIATGDLTYAEDLGAFVDQLSGAGKLGGGNLQAILREAIKLSPEDQKTFLDSIPTEEARKVVEKGLKDIKGNVLLDVDPTVFSNLKAALDNAGKGKNLNMDFLNLNGTKSIAARNAIEDLFASGIPIIQNLNKEFKDGKIALDDYAKGVIDSRTQIIESLTAETHNAEEAKKIYAAIGLINEVAQIKILIDGKPPKEASKIIKSYLDGFTKEEYPLKLKAQFELDPEQAKKDFISGLVKNNPKDKKLEYAGVDPTLLAELSKDLTGNTVKVSVIPEIKAEDRASYLASLATLNQQSVINILTTYPKKERDKLIADISSINPTIGINLAIGNAMNFAATAAGLLAKISSFSFGKKQREGADGGIFSTRTNIDIGEAGTEALIPLTRPARAMSLMKKSGLYDMVLNSVKNGGRGNYSSSSSTDNSQKIEVNVDMRGTKTTDPEGMALMLASRLTNGIRR